MQPSLPHFRKPMPAAGPPPLGSPLGLELLGPGDAGRAHAEAFVRAAFARRYQAQVGALLPHLACLVDAGGGLCAAAGVRSAGAGALFLEHYLDRPVEAYLRAGAGEAATRGEIVEIGNLAALRPGQFRVVVIALAAYLSGAGFRWVTCTAVESLRSQFERMGLAPMVLGRADPARLGLAAACWGRYYDETPQVIGGALRPAAELLAVRFARPGSPIQALWRNAWRLGYSQRISASGALGGTGGPMHALAVGA